jgi:hypothetical protein
MIAVRIDIFDGMVVMTYDHSDGELNFMIPLFWIIFKK